jgi:alkylhydroperoxidase family enzyme
VIAAPHAVAARWPVPRLRAIAELARLVSEAPWELSRAHRDRATDAGLSDDDVVHAIALSAFFGHLNRIADAVGAPLDYEVRHVPPHAEPATPAFAPAPTARTGPSDLSLAKRPATATALARWRAYVEERDAPLSRRQRGLVARWVARLVGDGTRAGDDAPGDAVERALRSIVETITLAPWRLSPTSFAELRGLGFDDAAQFDACVIATTANVVSRIDVALGALAG